jgi:hypothetical protein
MHANEAGQGGTRMHDKARQGVRVNRARKGGKAAGKTGLGGSAKQGKGQCMAAGQVDRVRHGKIRHGDRATHQRISRQGNTTRRHGTAAGLVGAESQGMVATQYRARR